MYTRMLVCHHSAVKYDYEAYLLKQKGKLA